MDVNRCFVFDCLMELPDSEMSKHKASSITPYKKEMSVFMHQPQLTGMQRHM